MISSLARLPKLGPGRRTLMVRYVPSDGASCRRIVKKEQPRAPRQPSVQHGDFHWMERLRFCGSDFHAAPSRLSEPSDTFQHRHSVAFALGFAAGKY